MESEDKTIFICRKLSEKAIPYPSFRQNLPLAIFAGFYFYKTDFSNVYRNFSSYVTGRAGVGSRRRLEGTWKLLFFKIRLQVCSAAFQPIGDIVKFSQINGRRFKSRHFVKLCRIKMKRAAFSLDYEKFYRSFFQQLFHPAKSHFRLCRPEYTIKTTVCSYFYGYEATWIIQIAQPRKKKKWKIV